MSHPKFLGMKLSEAEEAALILWAKCEGIDNKSTMMRRIFRLALRSMAPRSIFPAHIVDALDLRSNHDAAVISDVPSSPSPQQKFYEFITSLSPKAEKILDLHIQGRLTSYSRIAREVYGYTNGDNVELVKNIIERYKEQK